jgi:hypothetical protein
MSMVTAILSEELLHLVGEQLVLIGGEEVDAGACSFRL